MVVAQYTFKVSPVFITWNCNVVCKGCIQRYKMPICTFHFIQIHGLYGVYWPISQGGVDDPTYRLKKIPVINIMWSASRRIAFEQLILLAIRKKANMILFWKEKLILAFQISPNELYLPLYSQSNMNRILDVCKDTKCSSLLHHVLGCPKVEITMNSIFLVASKWLNPSLNSSSM